MQERNFSSMNHFHPYEYVDEDSSETFVSPFAVGVMGLRGEKLGAAELVGAVEGNEFGEVPVIRLNDGDETVEILGFECYWAPLADRDIAAMVEDDARNGRIMRVSTYLTLLQIPMN